MQKHNGLIWIKENVAQLSGSASKRHVFHSRHAGFNFIWAPLIISFKQLELAIY